MAKSPRPGIADAAGGRRQQQQGVHRGRIEGLAPAAPDSASRRRSRCVSELMWKNGAPPRCGSALTTPPPVSSSNPRSSEIAMCGALRACEMPLDLLGEVMHVDHRALDAGLGQPVEHMIDQRLAGDLDQRLRHRVGERPHARAEAGGQHHGGLRRDASSATFSAGTLARYQASSWRQRRMRQRALQIAPYARQMTQILRLAVAPLEPGENAEDLGGALRGERGIGAREGRRVEGRVGGQRARACSATAARSPSSPARRRARPATARRRRRRPGPSPHPGNRAGRCARRPRAPAATAGWANDSRAAPRSAALRSTGVSASRHSAI